MADIANVNGVNLWYEVNGSGDPVLQIHGCGFGHFNFSAATPILSQEFQTIDFDLRGYGQSDRPVQHYDHEVWADDSVALLDHLGIEKAHIHGTSMGGMVAQVLASKYPDRVQSVVINCSAAKLDYYGRLLFKNWRDIAEAHGPDSRLLAELISWQALAAPHLEAEGVAAVDSIQQILTDSNDTEVFIAAVQSIIDMDIREYAKTIQSPALVLGGDVDPMTPWVQAGDGAGQQWLADNIPGAEKYVIKGGSHSTIFDSTDEHCRVVGDFFRRNAIG
ncbi:alpha/beta fold hydrolase [Leucobacter sp. USHLN153]|uniref:alpha/beta fold hydrolase n=1 Tax=Leucobacter sp. USHLN153 TaxID=3081268 RepID=UPI0030179336